MYTLENNDLAVSILDPITDVAKLGSRYCTGGYIWQITDAEKGALLAGPHFPKPTPPVFDGQGAPDMFFMPLGAENISVGGAVTCIGVGLVRRTSDRVPFDVRFNPEVIEYVKWDVNQDTGRITMETQHAGGEWAYQLTRTIKLDGRTVHSRTEITNSGDSVLPIVWFPHPFFPLTVDNVLCKFSIPVSMPDNPSYTLNEDGFICRKPAYNWASGGGYQPLDYEPGGTGLTIVQKHDILGEVTAVTDYAPSFLPIWGNHNTFSFEPYLKRSVAHGQSTIWLVSYQF